MTYSRIEEVIDNYEDIAPKLYPSKQAITDLMVAGARAELAQLRDIAIAAQQERVEGQDGAGEKVLSSGKDDIISERGEA